MNDTDKKVSAKLREMRQERGVTQQKIADLIGLSHQAVQRIEKGEVRLSSGYMKIIADFFGVTPNDFYGEPDAEPVNNLCKVRLNDKFMEFRESTQRSLLTMGKIIEEQLIRQAGA